MKRLQVSGAKWPLGTFKDAAWMAFNGYIAGKEKLLSFSLESETPCSTEICKAFRKIFQRELSFAREDEIRIRKENEMEQMAKQRMKEREALKAERQRQQQQWQAEWEAEEAEKRRKGEELDKVERFINDVFLGKGSWTNEELYRQNKKTTDEYITDQWLRENS